MKLLNNRNINYLLIVLLFPIFNYSYAQSYLEEASITNYNEELSFRYPHVYTLKKSDSIYNIAFLKSSYGSIVIVLNNKYTNNSVKKINIELLKESIIEEMKTEFNRNGLDESFKYKFKEIEFKNIYNREILIISTVITYDNSLVILQKMHIYLTNNMSLFISSSVSSEEEYKKEIEGDIETILQSLKFL